MFLFIPCSLCALKRVAAKADHLHDWEQAVADLRIHGTIRQQVGKVFAE